MWCVFPFRKVMYVTSVTLYLFMCTVMLQTSLHGTFEALEHAIHVNAYIHVHMCMHTHAVYTCVCTLMQCTRVYAHALMQCIYMCVCTLVQYTCIVHIHVPAHNTTHTHTQGQMTRIAQLYFPVVPIVLAHVNRLNSGHASYISPMLGAASMHPAHGGTKNDTLGRHLQPSPCPTDSLPHSLPGSMLL